MARRQTPLESGERDKQITVQQMTESVDASNFPTEDWTTLAKMYASRMDMSSAERVRLDQLSARAETRWEVNYRADLDPDLLDVPKTRRLLYKGRVYDITGASIIGRNEGVELLTIAKVG